jgi:hypothetical protein
MEEKNNQSLKSKKKKNMTTEELKSRLDTLWETLPELERDLRVIRKDHFDQLCEAMMQIGHLQAYAELRLTIIEKSNQIKPNENN